MKLMSSFLNLEQGNRPLELLEHLHREDSWGSPNMCLPPCGYFYFLEGLKKLKFSPFMFMGQRTRRSLKRLALCWPFRKSSILSSPPQSFPLVPVCSFITYLLSKCSRPPSVKSRWNTVPFRKPDSISRFSLRSSMCPCHPQVIHHPVTFWWLCYNEISVKLEKMCQA